MNQKSWGVAFYGAVVMANTGSYGGLGAGLRGLFSGCIGPRALVIVLCQVRHGSVHHCTPPCTDFITYTPRYIYLITRRVSCARINCEYCTQQKALNSTKARTHFFVSHDLSQFSFLCCIHSDLVLGDLSAISYTEVETVFDIDM